MSVLTKSTFIALVCLRLFSLPAKRARADDYSSLLPQNPALSRFNDDITFYTSFDGYSVADLSVGKGSPREGAAPQWSDGIWNKALRGMAKPLTFEAHGNIDLIRPGAMTMWVLPQNWTHGGNPSYIHFVVVNYQGITLQVSRMGSAVNREALYAYMKIGSKGEFVKVGSSKDWKNEWHLLSVNWGEGYMEFSVDGSSFRRINTPIKERTNKDSGAIQIAGSGATPYLMDEFFIYNRPLQNEEMKWMWKTKAQEIQAKSS